MTTEQKPYSVRFKKSRGNYIVSTIFGLDIEEVLIKARKLQSEDKYSGTEITEIQIIPTA